MAALMSGPATETQAARVFLSYERGAKPDELLALQVLKALKALGHTVFIDQQLKIGQEWAKEIESEIRQSDFILVFLSETSSRSEMIKGEIELARSQAAQSGKPQILPIRVAFTGSLPYPLNAYLDKLQCTLWQGDNDTPKILTDLCEVLGGRALASPAPSLVSVRIDNNLPPAYAAPLPIPGGTLGLEDPWYLERPVDAEVLSLIRQLGQTIIIRGPQQMGKSSLLVRVIAQAKEMGKKAVLLDFQLLGHSTKESSDLFFRRFLAAIAEQLELPDQVNELYDPGLSNMQNCTRYFERQILAKLSAPLTLAIDEVDVLFETSFPADFFAMIRSWHNNRASPMKVNWKKLDLILVAFTEPHKFIDRPHESPFNVGHNLLLGEFSADQVQELNRRHGSPLDTVELQRLISLLGGHPYLTRKALYAVTKEFRPSDLFSSAIEDSGPFGDHLRYYLLNLQGKVDLAAALWRIVQGWGCEDELLVSRLVDDGLVKRRSGRVVPWCQLYADYFRERLRPRP